MSGFWLLALALGVAAYELEKRGKRTGATVCGVASIAFMLLDFM